MKLSVIAALTCAVLFGGALAPPNALSQHILFVASASSRDCFVLDMDMEGNLTYREGFAIGGYASDIAVSVNGRVVTVGSENRPRLSTFFVDRGGSISIPIYLDNPHLSGNSTSINPVCFHSTLPLIYAGFCPLSVIRYSEQDRSINLTTVTLTAESESGYFNFPGAMAYSRWADALIHQRVPTPPSQVVAVRSEKLDRDGFFTPQGSTVEWDGLFYTDLAVSLDGRWAAATGFALRLIRIDCDGKLMIANTIGPYAGYMMVAFTPDSKRLLVSSEGVNALTLYEINEISGLKPISVIPTHAPGWNMSTVLNVAITRDGKYAVFRSVHPKIFGYNIIHVVRIHEDGTLEYLHGKEIEVPDYIGPMAFTANPAYNAAGEWALYE